MKEGWKVKKLGDVFETGSGGTPLKIHKEYYEGGDIPWLRSGEVCKKYITKTEMYITKKGFDNSSVKFFSPNTVVVAMYGATAGQVGILKIATTTNQAICGIFPNEGYSPEFIYYLLLNNQKELVSQAVGNAQPNISQLKIKNISIPILSLSEQQRIVSILDAEFAKIERLKTNAERNLQNAKDLFQSALKKELEPKKGWKVKRLNEISVQMTDGPFGSNLKKEHYTNNKEVRIIQLSNIGEDGWKDNNIKYTTFEHLKTISRSEVFPNDIVIAKMMPAGRAIICPNYDPKYVLSSDAIKAKINDNFDTKFILYSINSTYFRNQVYENVAGCGRVRTSLTKLKECKLNIPSLSEQQTIVSRLDILNDKCKTLQLNYEKTIALCEDLRQAILRKAFNGEI